MPLNSCLEKAGTKIIGNWHLKLVYSTVSHKNDGQLIQQLVLVLYEK